MNIPFTTEQFLGTFADYNIAWWPLQIVLVAVAGLVLLLALRPFRRRPALAGRLLALLWAWTAFAYHLMVFTGVSRIGYLFALLFLLQALLLNGASRHGGLRFGWTGGAGATAGLGLVTYALVGYPLLGSALGHGYPAAPTFGAPCPLVIFTFGVLLLTTRRPPATLLVVPLAWVLFGTVAALRFGMLEDLGLAAAGILAIALLYGPHIARVGARGAAA